jgi:hypothetical protein
MPNVKGHPGTQTLTKTRPIPYALMVGFFAGVIWGALRIFFFALGFTEVVPGFLVEPFFKHDFLAGVRGYFVGWASFIVLSMIAALIYTIFAKMIKGPWPGVAYGLIWFGVLYLLLGPMIGLINRSDMDVNSILTDACTFVLWGVFIGYTITFEFTDERERSGQDGTFNAQ